MPSGGKRAGAGRKPFAEDKKRKVLSVRLSFDSMQWIECQPESNSVIIESLIRNCINNQYKIKEIAVLEAKQGAVTPII